MSTNIEEQKNEMRFTAIAKQMQDLIKRIEVLEAFLSSDQLKSIEMLLKEGCNANKINGIPVSKVLEAQGSLIYDNKTGTYITKKI